MRLAPLPSPRARRRTSAQHRRQASRISKTVTGGSLPLFFDMVPCGCFQTPSAPGGRLSACCMPEADTLRKGDLSPPFPPNYPHPVDSVDNSILYLLRQKKQGG